MRAIRGQPGPASLSAARLFFSGSCHDVSYLGLGKRKALSSAPLQPVSPPLESAGPIIPWDFHGFQEFEGRKSGWRCQGLPAASPSSRGEFPNSEVRILSTSMFKPQNFNFSSESSQSCDPCFSPNWAPCRPAAAAASSGNQIRTSRLAFPPFCTPQQPPPSASTPSSVTAPSMVAPL